MLRRCLPFALVLLTAASAFAAEPAFVFEAALPADAGDFVLLPFEVPEGIAEVEVRHRGLTSGHILDWGLEDPNGFRGWGGGNTEPAIVGEHAASRSYLARPMTPGTWNVVVGLAKVPDHPSHYRVEIFLRTEPTLAPQTERRPYVPVPALKKEARWYAGDFHVHSRESGDARPSIDTVAEFARSRGLDFIELSEHNTTSHLDFILDAQERFPELLILPGIEFTTYAGHANAIGAAEYVDHRIGLNGRTVDDAARRITELGAVFALNHPVLDLGSLCIGCAWKQPVSDELVGGVEIATGGWEEVGSMFTPQAITLWDAFLERGLRVAPIGGSDDHRGGINDGPFQSPIGSATTMVYASELSAKAIVDAVRAGRTVVKLQGPDDPMVDLRSGTSLIGDTVRAGKAVLRAEVTGGVGHVLKWVRDGSALEEVEITSDPFVIEREVFAPAEGETRWRAEVHVDGHPRTVTGHIWIAPAVPDSGCGCAGAGVSALPLLALVGWFARRRRM